MQRLSIHTAITNAKSAKATAAYRVTALVSWFSKLPYNMQPELQDTVRGGNM